MYPPDPYTLIQQEDSDNDSTPSRRAGKRKIKIEYIQDKSRRHITFSKRKAGIMKKAYELSTLTGTQVLLLVVSETGLVYTFTTPKLQPIVANPQGKNLIQSCLNALEPHPDNNTVVKSEPCDPVYNVPVIKYNTAQQPHVQQQSHSLVHNQGQHSHKSLASHQSSQLYHQSPQSLAVASQQSSQSLTQHRANHQPSQIHQQSPQSLSHEHSIASHHTTQLHQQSNQPLSLHALHNHQQSNHSSIPHTVPITPNCPVHPTSNAYQSRYYQGDYNTPPTPYPSYNYPSPYQ